MSTQTLTYDEVQLVDDYIVACAEAAQAEARKDAAKQALVASGASTLRGTLNKVRVTLLDGRAITDVKQMVADGVLSESLVAAYTRRGAPSVRVTVSAL